ncbi:MAG TPA: VWA domain-containing protein [Bacillota bacterium]|nr:VWA domain-containing protein [Bacillota bacterium]
MKFRFDYGHYIDLMENAVTVSHYWDNLPRREMEAGCKTDLFLRVLGTLRYSNEEEIMQYSRYLDEIPIRKFAVQLFTLMEDLRLEEICKKDRPGTARLFEIRRREYEKYFESQRKVNTNRGYSLDELFCMLYLTFFSNSPDLTFPDANELQIQMLEKIKPSLYQIFDARSTNEVGQIARQIVNPIAGYYERDCLNEYFVLPVLHTSLLEDGLTFDDLKRKAQLKNEDQNHHQNRGSEEAKAEKLPTWHAETKEKEQSRSFLQFDVESGTKIQMLGGTPRETEDGDQAMGAVQGKAMASKNQDYNQTEHLNHQDIQDQKKGGQPLYGEANRDAVLIRKHAQTPTPVDIEQYQSLIQDVDLHIRKLSKTIEKLIEHKNTQTRKDLQFGRLSKKWLPLILEEYPRVFYKKNNQSKEIDAVFTLLVDCSASMYDKMDETKKGIALFHEVLKKLRIPHSIVGFWEDANQVKEGYQPNYYHIIKDFQHSIYGKSGAEIMQLEPQEDNRDGFSLRIATEYIERRSEKNKFLLLFSDGEPAAANYDQNGIVDTREAVLAARKKGIQVIGMFLSNQPIAEEEELTMQNIYGREHVLIPSVEELPQLFSPLLKKLLLKSI